MAIGTLHELLGVGEDVDLKVVGVSGSTGDVDETREITDVERHGVRAAIAVGLLLRGPKGQVDLRTCIDTIRDLFGLQREIVLEALEAVKAWADKIGPFTLRVLGPDGKELAQTANYPSMLAKLEVASAMTGTETDPELDLVHYYAEYPERRSAA